MKKSFLRRNKGIVIFLAILLVFVIAIFSFLPRENYGKNGSYVAVLKIEGTISEASEGLSFSQNGYDEEFIMNTIKKLEKDSSNRGILLYINSPGGSVSASDSLYLRLMDYKRKTNRPVYAYFYNMAASGGYYVACAADEIFSDRNAWTGSIGVTLGDIYNASELLNKIGIKAVNISSGPNKAMGSMTQPMMPEQEEIFRGLVEDAYGQFLGIVSEARGISVETLRPIADGRVYTANQGKALGLVDEITTLDGAKAKIRQEGKESLNFVEITKPKSVGLLDSYLLGGNSSSQNREAKMDKALDLALKALGDGSQAKISYMSPITK
ncbi:TPA: signal peptide peptidase SppA [Streptococcus suis]|nr:signal peptide peptidase SppA [Streptococcus suis]